MVHLLPICINFTLLGLYIRNVYWTPPQPSTNILNALQFGAKLHEALMVASLTEIVLYHIRHRLLAPDSPSRGLPLGLLTAPFRLLDVSYLFSREFWAALRHPAGHIVLETMTSLLLVSIFVLAATLGAASAIAMQPRIGQWELARRIVDAPFYRQIYLEYCIHQIYIDAPLSDIFPLNITADFIPEACDYSNPSAPQSNTCARVGLADILEQMYPPLLESASLSYPPPAYNISVQQNSDYMLPSRTISTESSSLSVFNFTTGNVTDLGFLGAAITSTDAILCLFNQLPAYYLKYWSSTMPTSLYFEDLSSIGEWPVTFSLYADIEQQSSNKGMASWKQPYVTTLCSQPNELDITESLGSMSFSFDDSNRYTVIVSREYIRKQLNKTSTSFMDISAFNITPSINLSAILAYNTTSSVTLCLVRASWMNMTLSGQVGTLSWSFDVANEHHTEDFWGVTGWFNMSHSRFNINLDLEWLQVLNYGTGNGKSVNNGYTQKLWSFCSGASDPVNESPLDGLDRGTSVYCMASGVSLGIAEGLSKVPWSLPIYALGSSACKKDTFGYSTYQTVLLSPWTPILESGGLIEISNIPIYPEYSGNWTPSSLTPSEVMANATHLDFFISQRLYAYGFRGVTTILAFVALFLYVFIVFIHFLILLIGPSWSSTSWASPGELLLLALQSPVPTSAVLENTSGGVKLCSTWRRRAFIGEMQEGKRVGIMVEGGDQDGGKGGMVSKVQPDRKYS